MISNGLIESPAWFEYSYLWLEVSCSLKTTLAVLVITAFPAVQLISTCTIWWSFLYFIQLKFEGTGQAIRPTMISTHFSPKRNCLHREFFSPYRDHNSSIIAFVWFMFHSMVYRSTSVETTIFCSQKTVVSKAAQSKARVFYSRRHHFYLYIPLLWDEISLVHGVETTKAFLQSKTTGEMLDFLLHLNIKMVLRDIECKVVKKWWNTAHTFWQWPHLPSMIFNWEV